jgi:putative transposase
MYLVEKHIIKASHPLFNECDELCFKSKNLYNYANYLIRQSFIKSSSNPESKFIGCFELSKLFAKDNQIDYRSLPAKVSNATLINLDNNWKAFFALIKKRRKDKGSLNGVPKIPKYLHKKNGRYVVSYELGAISRLSLKKGIVKLSGTNIQIPTKQTNIKQCRIVPRNGFYVIEIVYEKEVKQPLVDNERYCSIDLGVNNLATVTSNVLKPIVINGKPLKSINQFYNKKKGKLQSLLAKRNNKKTSKRIQRLTNKRNNKINDYLHKSSKYIINHLVSNNINTLIIGKNEGWKQEVNMGKKNNQNFVNIPHARYIGIISYKCKLEGINVIITEESYSSKCSFIDNEEVCKHGKYLGKRPKRGMFISSNGIKINADVNGSLNIMRKVVPNVQTEGIEVIAVAPRIMIF